MLRRRASQTPQKPVACGSVRREDWSAEGVDRVWDQHPLLVALAASSARELLSFAFAFAVMADPVSSVAYAIEAGLRALAGDLLLLVPTMFIVLGIISIVRLNYDQLIRRFPQGGGALRRPARRSVKGGRSSLSVP